MRSCVFGVIGILFWILLSIALTTILLFLGLALPLPHSFRASDFYAISPLALSAIAEELARLCAAGFILKMRSNGLVAIASAGLGVAVAEFASRAVGYQDIGHSLIDYAPAAALHVASATMIVFGLLTRKTWYAVLVAMSAHVAFNIGLGKHLTISHNNNYYYTHAIVFIVISAIIALAISKRIGIFKSRLGDICTDNAGHH